MAGFQYTPNSNREKNNLYTTMLQKLSHTTQLTTSKSIIIFSSTPPWLACSRFCSRTLPPTASSAHRAVAGDRVAGFRFGRSTGMTPSRMSGNYCQSLKGRICFSSHMLTNVAKLGRSVLWLQPGHFPPATPRPGLKLEAATGKPG